jgi:hypothetical protein
VEGKIVKADIDVGVVTEPPGRRTVEERYKRGVLELEALIAPSRTLRSGRL